MPEESKNKIFTMLPKQLIMDNICDPKWPYRATLFRQNNVDEDVLIKAISSNDSYLIRWAIGHEKASSKVLSKVIDCGYKGCESHIIYSPVVNSIILTRLMKSDDAFVKLAACSRGVNMGYINISLLAIQNNLVAFVPKAISNLKMSKLSSRTWLRLIATGNLDNYLHEIPKCVLEHPEYKAHELIGKLCINSGRI